MRIAKIGFMPSSRMAMFRVSMTGSPDAVLQLLLTARFGALLFDNWKSRKRLAVGQYRTGGRSGSGNLSDHQ
jgi:hypothetical protein